MSNQKVSLGKRIKGYKKLYLSFKALGKNNIMLRKENLSKLTYRDLYQLHYILNYKQYNAVMRQLEDLNLARLKKQDKVKLSFVLLDSSMWCGDLLYELLAGNPRFEVNILLCESLDVTTPSALDNFLQGAEKLRQRGLNVRVIRLHENYQLDSDILFFLTPYFTDINCAFWVENIPLNKLIAFVSYGLYTSNVSIQNDFMIRYLEWREFIDSKTQLKDVRKFAYRHGDGVIYTGYPRMDTFYQEKTGRYSWKCVNSKAKKIIWAPHWSIQGGIRYATFQENYKWFYEYAKAHPETTSWVVKPHPILSRSAVDCGIFKTDADFHDYMKAWDLLPNAKVETGAYYQDIFKTSDAMILDSCSFIAEYQYTHNPQLFLTRDTDQFSALGKAAVDANYTADGADFDTIKSFIENIVGKGQDTKKSEREQMFERYLDYYSDLGQLASESIYNQILSEVGNS